MNNLDEKLNNDESGKTVKNQKSLLDRTEELLSVLGKGSMDVEDVFKTLIKETTVAWQFEEKCIVANLMQIASSLDVIFEQNEFGGDVEDLKVYLKLLLTSLSEVFGKRFTPLIERIDTVKTYIENNISDPVDKELLLTNMKLIREETEKL